MDEPLVSVVVPCLNRAHYLRPTLDSILAQEYPRVECVVMDGGSSDETVEILRGYGDRIRWVSEKDNGQADAINKGWQMCGGDILTWLNADDLWAVPDAVRNAVRFFADHPDVDLVYGDCMEIDAAGNQVGMIRLRPWSLEYAVEECDHCFTQPASFIRRRMLQRAGWLDVSFRQLMDQELWVRAGLHSRFAYLPVQLASARTLPDDTSHQRATAHACLRLTRKFFESPDVPPQLRRKRRRAISNSYIKGMIFAHRAAAGWPAIYSYACRSALADPRNAPRSFGLLLEVLEAEHSRSGRFGAQAAFLRLLKKVMRHFAK